MLQKTINYKPYNGRQLVKDAVKIERNPSDNSCQITVQKTFRSQGEGGAYSEYFKYASCLVA